ncbi:helix-turn-helix domain-containing protein [Flavobacterium sp. XGLA_31]|uniref:helix-turn-helix domain-containing protein n=1 Tax=Flavobacterium sp. XGLA_31 TaxID=3447666 RepID=UPI003F303A0B
MKRESTIRSILGVTQQDMAMLLKVSRSQWAMYELGKRDLPLAAKQLLGEMLQYVTGAKNTGKSLPQVARQEEKRLQLLERLLKENEYQQLRIARKIEALQKKYTAKVGVLHLVDFLTERVEKKAASEMSLLKHIANKAIQTLDKYNLSNLLKYELKQEVLQHEKVLLDASLLKLQRSAAE